MRAVTTTTIPGRWSLTAGALVAALATLLAPSMGQAQSQCDPVDIGTDESVGGALGAGDCTIAQLGIDLDDTSFVDVYRVVLPSSGSLTVELESGDFDAFLGLFDAAIVDHIAFDDDGGVDTDSLILDVSLAAGTYIILANSFFADETGAYTLTTTSAESNPACDVVMDLPANAVAQGMLSNGDCTLASVVPDNNTSYVDQYRVTLPTGGPLTVRLESNAFDAFLWLFDGSLTNLIDIDDDSGGEFNSLLSDVQLDPGSYVILANSFDVQGTGSYTLTLIPEPSSTLLGSVALATVLALSRTRRARGRGR